MNNGIKIVRKTKSTTIDKAKQAEDLQILFKGKDLEIMHQHINASSSVWIEPAKSITTVEFFYVLNGKLEIVQDDNIIELNAGDSFVAIDLSKKFMIKIVESLDLLYVTNANIYEELNEFNENLDMIINSIDETEKYTKIHCSHVAYICERIYYKLYDKSNINFDQLILAALFHDVGKTYIPTELLNFTGIYTPEQFEITKKHVNDGYSIVQPLYGEEIGQIILQHHERLDGSGYLGICDKEIPYESKIIAVADAFDAMTSPRSYKKVFSFKDACLELLALNKQYDEEIVRCLLSIVDDGSFNEEIEKLSHKK